MNLKALIKLTTFFGVLLMASMLPAATVTLVTGVVSGTIQIGSATINEATISGSSIRANPFLTVTANTYNLVVKVDENSSTDYTITTNASTDNKRDRMGFKPVLVNVADGQTVPLDFIVDPGFIQGTVTATDTTMSGVTLIGGEITAFLNDGVNYTNASTRLGPDGSFSFPVQPNANITISGDIDTSDGRQFKLDSKTVTVDAQGTVTINWSIDIPPPPPADTPGSVTGEVALNGVGNIDSHWISGGGFTIASANGPYNMSNVTPGTYDVRVTTNLNTNDDSLTHPESSFIGGRSVTVTPGGTATKDVSNIAAFINGAIGLSGSKTWADVNSASIKFSGVPGSVSQSAASYDWIALTNGSYDMVVIEGDWVVDQITLNFKDVDLANYVDSDLNLTDPAWASTPLTLSAGRTLDGQDMSYETGTVTVNFLVKGGDILKSPRMTVICPVIPDPNSLEQIATGSARGSNVETTVGSVTFVGIPLPTPCYMTAFAAVKAPNSTDFTKNNVFAEDFPFTIEPGEDKIINIGGPALSLSSPIDQSFSNQPSVTVSGTVTDAAAVIDTVTVSVNGTGTGTGIPFLVTGNPENEVSFSVEQPLQLGANTIEVVATDVDGVSVNEIRTVFHDAGAPVLNWTPVNGATTDLDSVTVTGTASDDLEVKQVTVNGTVMTLNTTPGIPGEASFSTTVPLNEGVNDITVVATDGYDQATSETRTVTRTVTSPANTAPLADAGSDILIECVAGQTDVVLDGSGSSDVDSGDSLTYTWTGPFGSVTGMSPTVSLDEGTHNVTLTVSDNSQASATDEVQIVLGDTTAPTINAGPDVVLEADGTNTAYYNGLSPATSDNCSGVTLSYAPNQTTYPVGDTIVTVTATDVAGNASTDKVTITVKAPVVDQDTTPPGYNFELLHDTLWPPNHKMVLSARVSNVSDNEDTAPAVDIVVTSNQPVLGVGSGFTTPDWDVVQNGTVWEIWLRAERSGQLGARVYSITVNVSDASGNNAQPTQAKVTVPHDQGNNGGGNNSCDDSDSDSDSDSDAGGDSDSDSDECDEEDSDSDSDSDRSEDSDDLGDSDSDGKAKQDNRAGQNTKDNNKDELSKCEKYEAKYERCVAKYGEARCAKYQSKAQMCSTRDQIRDEIRDKFKQAKCQKYETKYNLCLNNGGNEDRCGKHHDKYLRCLDK